MTKIRDYLAADFHDQAYNVNNGDDHFGDNDFDDHYEADRYDDFDVYHDDDYDDVEY